MTDASYCAAGEQLKLAQSSPCSLFVLATGDDCHLLTLGCIPHIPDVEMAPGLGDP